ncbi:MAG: hydrogenase iron-sulfur subunit [Desulfosarcinaceae bacterium]
MAWQPKIIAFFCNWCTYGAADLAGVSRLQYPPNIRVIRVPCSGRISPKFILSALRNGADGVWVSGCHPGDCHYIEGNFYARRKFALLKNLLEFTGIEPGRVQFSWISSAESTKFAKVAKEVTDTVQELGPARHMVKSALGEALMMETPANENQAKEVV